MVLDIPFVSQLGSLAGVRKNDCGPACCSMLVKAYKDSFISPDAWYGLEGWGAPGTDVGTTAYQLRSALGLYNIRAEVFSGVDERWCLKEGRPVISLVDYKVLSDNGLTAYTGNFLHWVLLVGYDEQGLIMYDPYRLDAVRVSVRDGIYDKAFRNSCLVCVDGLEGVSMDNAVVINCLVLNVRETPPVFGKLGNKVGSLRGGERIFIDKQEGGWGHYSGGWVSMAYIQLNLEEAGNGREDELNRMVSYIESRKKELNVS